MEITIENADRLWSSLLREYDFLKVKVDVQEKIQETRKQLKRKEVIVSVFGRHNCGKSTLLNALLGNSCLPVDYKNETGIEVKIKHDKHVHSGYCGDDCKGSTCPRLVLEVSNEGEGEKEGVTIGADDICDELHSANKQWRQTGMKSAKDDRRKYTLYAYIPILEGAPPNWTLALVDTPGFGEANVEHVTALTDTLFSTSTAYLYILDSGNMGDAVDAENIRQLYKYDNDLFNDGRFVVAISKYDLCFPKKSLRRRREKAVTVQSMQQTAQSFICSSTGVHPPTDIAIPVSAQWAELVHDLRHHPSTEDMQRAKGFLDLYPDQQPQGQGEAAMSPLNLAAGLETISGVPHLEGRLRKIIEHCITIWKTSLVKAYTGYLCKAKEALMDYHEQKQMERADIQTMLNLHTKYKTEKQKLTDQAFVEDDEKTEIEAMLEKKYAEIDVKAAKRLLHGRIDAMVKAFSNELKGRVANTERPFLQRDFEAEVKQFIQEEAEHTLSAEQENMKLEGVGAVFRNFLEKMEELDRGIEEIAKNILPRNWSPANDVLRKERATRGDRDILSDHVLQRKQLTLSDLQKKAKAPPLKISLFQRFCDRVKAFFGKKVEPDEERSYRKWGKEMDEAVESLRADLVGEVDAYITGTLQRWVIYEVLSIAYRNRVKKRAQALLETYEGAIREAESQLEETRRCCASDEDMETLKERMEEVTTAQKNLEQEI